MMETLFPKSNSYDNEGYLNVNSNNELQRAKVTFTPAAGGGGALLNIYDMNSATECNIISSAAATGEIIWEFDQKPLFKNFILDGRTAIAGGSSITVTIEGSNNGTDWTVLATKAVSSSSSFNLIASDVNYKYVKIKYVGLGGDSASWVTNVQAAGK